MNLEFKSGVCKDGVILFLYGNLDFSEKESFLNTMEKYKEGTQPLLIDVQNVSLIDSAGLGMLALMAQKCQKANRVVKIVNPRGQVRDCLQQTNFPALIPVVDSDSQYLTFTPIPT